LPVLSIIDVGAIVAHSFEVSDYVPVLNLAGFLQETKLKNVFVLNKVEVDRIFVTFFFLFLFLLFFDRNPVS
jgi:hypothetical protein